MGFAKRCAPLWARLVIAAACLALVTAGSTLGPGRHVPAGAHGPAIDDGKPLNLLLVGIDPRGTHTIPLADTIIVAHIPADRRTAYLFSLPRDLVVQIPAFAKTGTPAQRAKINAAMALGSRTGPDRYDAAQGLELLTRTVGHVTGIPKFDAGAVLDFGGFTTMITAMGGVTMVIDQDVVSEHRKPDGSPRDRLPACQGHHRCLRPYTGVQKIYRKSPTPVRLSGWEALDYVRQRYGLPRVDYDRQRHQRQLIKALARQVRADIVTDPARLVKVTEAIGDSLTFTGSGHGVTDWAMALRKLNVDRITSINLPGAPVFENGRYLGEKLAADAFFTAVTEDRVRRFLLDNPTYLDPAI